MDILGWFTDPFAYAFMQRALVVSLLVAAVCAVLSCYLVLKGWSLMGDAISHAVFPGVVIAFLLVSTGVAGLFAGALLWLIALATHNPSDPVGFFNTGRRAFDRTFAARSDPRKAGRIANLPYRDERILRTRAERDLDGRNPCLHAGFW